MSGNEFNVALERLRSLVAVNNLHGRLLAHWFGVYKETSLFAENKNAIWTYQEVAAIAVKHAVSEKTEKKFSDGLDYLMRRHYFTPHSIPGFEVDPIAILCVTIGVISLGYDKDKYNWLLDIINKTLLDESESNRKNILLLASFLLNEETYLPLMIKAALGKKYSVKLNEFERESIFKECLTTKEVTPEQSIFYLAAIEYLISTTANISIESTNTEGLAKVLRSVEASLKRWPWEIKAKTPKSSIQQWDIQNEYHVQSLLWALLRPIFPDLKDEEYLQSIGYKHPRVDLAIPSLKTIIDVETCNRNTSGQQ